MRFSRAGQPNRPAPSLACYGKLPCYSDFLQVGIDSPVGRWMVESLDAAHDEMTASGTAPDPRRELRIILRPASDRATPLAALLRPSGDARGRRYPVIVAAQLSAAEWVDEPHLAPLCAAPLWSSLARHVIENPGRSRDELLQRLQSLPDQPDDLTFARQRFTRLVEVARTDPWGQLVGGLAASADDAAGGRKAVVVLTAPRAGLAAQVDPAELAAVWLRLWSAASPGEPWEAMVEVWQRDAPVWSMWALLQHLPSGAELAALLSRPAAELAAVLAASGAARQAIEARIGAGAVGCLADLWAPSAAPE